MIRDMLLLVDDADAAAAMIARAMSLRERLDASLDILALTLPPTLYAGLAPVGEAWIPPFALAVDDAALTSRLRAETTAAGERVTVTGVVSDTSGVADRVRRIHPVQDVILFGESSDWLTPGLRERLLETLLLGTGTPILLIPANTAPFPVRRCVFGWKPSGPAARALNDVIRLMADDAQLDLVCVGEGDPDDTIATEAVEAHLRRHGVRCAVHHLPHDGATTATRIERFALEQGADLIAVGGYARSRVREILLGGVTRQFVQGVRVPVLMSH